MLLVGFAGIAFGAHRCSRKGAVTLLEAASSI
jgi:hypothetical protein